MKEFKKFKKEITKNKYDLYEFGARDYKEILADNWSVDSFQELRNAFEGYEIRGFENVGIDEYLSHDLFYIDALMESEEYRHRTMYMYISEEAKKIAVVIL